MGSCISTPVKAGRIITPRKFYHDNKSSKALPEHNETPPAQRAMTFYFESVVKEPTGNNIFEKYRFGKELGRGEFGITHQCFDIETGENYACKTISKSKLKTEVDVEDVRREVEIMRQLPCHPNIVSFKEAYEDKEAVHLVMELCEGGELFNRIIAKGHYTERAAAMVTKTILEVVKVKAYLCKSFLQNRKICGNSCQDLAKTSLIFGSCCYWFPEKNVERQGN